MKMRNKGRFFLLGAGALILLAAIHTAGGPFNFTLYVPRASAQEAISDSGQLPGAVPLNAALQEQLDQAWAVRAPNYQPRTKHLNPDGSPEYTNRLFLETSPYLLQHAHNPVNWYPWGDEAFETARELNRPVLLSVGYSTCHWCHVMEEESFDDLEIARYINEHYIAIKVDREVRPDIDAVYMTAVQAITGHGGWPMTVWLTQNREPYYGGTYFPARDGDRGASRGFLTLLRELGEVYHAEPETVAGRARQITDAISEMLEPTAGGSLPGATAIRQLVEHYRANFDETHGGFKGAPKFPSSMSVRLLLRYHRRTGDQQTLRMAARTLERMARGGIRDHVGGGFHRYSTDVRWLVPHFEKMLYDNALLTSAYIEGYQASGNQEFADIAGEILRYVERDMTSPEGAFYSATDADSLNPEGEREEGWFFTWTPAELEMALGPERAPMVSAYYGVTTDGNFEGRNIFHVTTSLAHTAQQLGVTTQEFEATLQTAKEELYQARSRRPAPLRDEKILTSWNALMISAHAQAALAFDDRRYLQRAETAADFVLSNLQQNGRLLRSYNNSQARHKAYLDDYAFFIGALLDLYEAGGGLRWIEEAIRLQGVLETHYWDEENGGFFATSGDHEELIAREKPSYDGAEPSGNSVAVMNLVRLHEFTTDDRYRQRAEQCFQAFSPILARGPAALSEMLLALDFYLDNPKEILIVTPNRREEATELLARLRAAFLPNRILSVVTQGEQLDAHAKVLPLLEDKRAIGGKPTAYVCEQRVCELPTSDSAVFAEQIAKVKPLAPSP